MPDTYKTYEEVWNLPLKPYTCLDNKGRRVKIMPKNPAHHESNHPLEQTSTFFYNLGDVILNPDSIEKDTSKNPIAIASRKKGKCIKYLKNNFIKDLKIPGYMSTWKGDQILVVVMYEKTGKNYTKTYRVIKK